MEELSKQLVTLCTTVGKNIVLALLVFIIGKMIINKLLESAKKMPWLDKMDQSVKTFMLNMIKVVLYVVLVVSIINILGVPMASVVAVLASAGLAVGLALQGALSNLAGGIMIMIFRPFNVGDYVITSGVEGVVREINLFYTVLTTTDNKRITVPTGGLMGATVTNCSSEPLRRVDLVFSCGKGEDVHKVQDVMIDVMNKNEKVLNEPAPFASVSGGTNEAMEFTVRAWCNGSDYWDVYFDVLEHCSKALNDNGIDDPEERIAVRIVKDEQ